MLSRSKTRLELLKTGHTGNVFLLTEPAFKLMIRIIKDDFIISEIQESEIKQGKEKDINFVKRINAYKSKLKDDLTLQYINDKEAEYYLKTRNKTYNSIKRDFKKKKITFENINDKDSEYYLDETKQTYYYNLFHKLFSKPTQSLEKEKITFTGFTIEPARTSTSINKNPIPQYENKRGGMLLLGTTPPPQNILYDIHYVLPKWSYFTRARSDLNIYSTQLPYQFNRFIMLQTFIYYMYVKEIKILLNLQGCDTNTNHGSNLNHLNPNGKGCNISDMKSEGKIWELAKNITVATQNDANIKYITAGIADFDPGTLNNWDKIFSNVGDTKLSKNKIAIHCLAGLGRTGSVVLSLMMRDVIHPQWLRDNIIYPHINYGSIQDLIKELKLLFDVNPESQKIMVELFDTDPSNLQLLRTRLNCIFYSIAKYHKFQSFSMYHKVPNSYHIDTVFTDVRNFKDIDWDTHSITDFTDTIRNAFFRI
jgi:hypothetical protein